MQLSSNVAGRIVALDLGEVRTGVAISDEGRVISRPLKVVQSAGLESYLEALLRDEGVAEVLVGVPKTLGGDIGFQARRVLDKLHDLKDRFPEVKFVEWDERHTTRMVSAGRARAARGGRRKGRGGKSSERVDHLAAAQMLQEYLESGRGI